MDSMNYKERKRKNRNIIIIVIAVVFFISLPGLFLFSSINRGRAGEIRYAENNMQGIVYMALAQEILQPKDAKNEYSNVVDAMKSYSDLGSVVGPARITGYPSSENILLQLETDSQILLLIISRGGTTILDSKMNSIYTFIFDKVGDGVSYPVYCYSHLVEGDATEKYTYEDLDRVGRDVLSDYAASSVTKDFNGGNTFYYGAGLGEEMQSLTILGEKPTEVVPVTFGEETYYFWYYLGDTGFDSVISEKIDMYTFVMADVIDILQIKI